MSKTTIEKTGEVKRIANVNWDLNTQMANLTYDSTKTNVDEILKRTALAGYDNEKYLAPEKAYANLPNDCQYERVLKPMSKNMDMKMGQTNHSHTKMDEMSNSGNHNITETERTMDAPLQDISSLQSVFNEYFALKDALVKSDADMASSKATALAKGIKAVDMDKLSSKEHRVWMDVLKDLIKNTESISKVKDIEKQRKSFAQLSKKVYELAKVSKYQAPIYYQHCPMKDENWLSKDEQIKNPYFGSQMLTCGSTVEALK